MSRLFGPLRQIGLVVRDIDAALRHWTEVNGVGPWFLMERYALQEFRYRGAAQQGLIVSIALAYSGGTQLELIQQRSDTPSMYRDFLGAGQEGMQHWAAWAEDYDAARERALARGMTIGQEGDATGRGRFAYFESAGHPGSVVELVELTESRARGFAMMQQAAEGWDGRDPVRRL